ncbi:MAG: GTP 3',8-cyclase MoaA [Lachnospiraceae bacterium]|nr:GTP 3',8-cyclase MoaA [Lachnospiraceae bacterium]
MKDRLGRTIDYMRISVTDRCNFRCAYCMPAEGVELLGHEEILRFEEMLTVVRAAAGLGISKIRVTGGELFVRRKVMDFLKELTRIPGIGMVSVTTNGSLLLEHLEELKQAGIGGINISLDTMEPGRFRQLTGRDELDHVLAAVKRAAEMNFARVKINCVPMKNYNEKDLVPITALARDYPVDVRFIELMPMGLGRRFQMVSQERVMELLEQEYGKLEPDTREKERAGQAETVKMNCGNGPAVYYRLPGFTGSIGFISALSHEFCGSCNRIRLLADGSLKACLNYGSTVNVRDLLRSGADEAEIREVLQKVIWEKPARHGFENQAVRPEREDHMMSSIGG